MTVPILSTRPPLRAPSAAPGARPRPRALRLVARTASDRVGAALAALALVGAVGCGGAAHAESGAPAADGGGAPVAVQVAPAARTARPAEVRAGGVLEPRATADLAFQVGGRVDRVPVDEGSVVARGAVLAALDPTDYALALRQAELQAARADDERRRAGMLLDAGSIAPNDYERLDTGARQATVARDLAAKRLRDATLVAPFAGTVAARRTDVGATAAAGTTAFTLVDLGAVHVRIGVPEGDVGALRPGQVAQVELPALGRTVAGRVQLVGVAADPASRTYAVRIVVPNDDRALRAGMVASVAIATGASRAVVGVPATAVARDPEGATRVYLHDTAAGRARARRVTVGVPLADGAVEIVDGLEAGEPIIVAGQERLRDGARVSAVDAAPAAAARRTTP
jgi:RND family efflux transporter MFP subunit